MIIMDSMILESRLDSIDNRLRHIEKIVYAILGAVPALQFIISVGV